MYQLGQKIVYGSHGVCNIVDLEDKKVDGKMICYFVLEPADHPGTRYYLPAANPAALAKSRPLSTKEQMYDYLRTPVTEDIWIDHENKRKQRFRELLSSVDLRAMIDMVRVLREHRQVQLAQGRKFHQCDDNFLRDAQRIISAEVSVVFQIPMEQVESCLQQIVECK